ncbi:MAG TPA: PspC domain-containing protein, partial [Solirubrobacteraceae bacterium]
MAPPRAPEAPAPSETPPAEAPEPPARALRAALSPVPRSPRAPRRPLRRRPDRGLLGGVCAGVAEHLDAEVALVRLLMAAVVAVGGIGVALYALAWALIPVAPESEGVPRRPGAWREAVLIVLAVAGALVALRFAGVRFG